MAISWTQQGFWLHDFLQVPECHQSSQQKSNHPWEKVIQQLRDSFIVQIYAYCLFMFVSPGAYHNYNI